MKTNEKAITLRTNDEHDRLSRRDFLSFSGRLAAASALNWTFSACSRQNKREDPTLRIGYLPITDATPLLVGYAKGFFEEEGVRTEKPVLIRGWSSLSESFLTNRFNLVHLLLPIPIYMRFSQRFPVKVVAWDHMNGSAITSSLASGVESIEDLAGKQIAVPYWYSIHNILLQLGLRHYDIEVVVQARSAPLKKNQTNLLVMPPPDMPAALASKAIDGYAVAEPFNAAGELFAGGRITRFLGDIFKDHPCCVAVMQESTLNNHPEWSQKVLNAFVKAQHWAANNRDETARILSKDGGAYLPFSYEVIRKAIMHYDLKTYGLETGTGAIRHPAWRSKRLGFQPYPFRSATEEVVKLLKQTRVEGDSSFLANLEPEQVASELFDFHFVRRAADNIGGLKVFEGINPADPYVRTEVIEV